MAHSHFLRDISYYRTASPEAFLEIASGPPRSGVGQQGSIRLNPKPKKPDKNGTFSRPFRRSLGYVKPCGKKIALCFT
jgi:hypothetical protein